MTDSTYDIITVDWDRPQTALWRKHVERHCPTANIITIPDAKPIKWNWSSGKINCFKYDFPHPGRVMYLDTDTLVTRDLSEMWSIMEEGDWEMAASSSIPMMGQKRSFLHRKKDRLDPVNKAFGLEEVPVHWSTGFMVFRDYPLMDLYQKWLWAMEYPVFKSLKGARVFEEFAFSYVVAADKTRIWPMPGSIHGNIVSSRAFFGRLPKDKKPLVVHYHKINRLKKLGLGKWID